eukprot:TRINITY_DN10382_c0_g1_i1.p2 TRINITY_DN10382_c0_g1~~TRINITY_DN10382_c0_g1_i1.p2  ORF type:complete len:253 (+),score=9.52 TRINITY_DN10382_c0_g1_i1:1123-1881(+)
MAHIAMLVASGSFLHHALYSIAFRVASKVPVPNKFRSQPALFKHIAAYRTSCLANSFIAAALGWQVVSDPLTRADVVGATHPNIDVAMPLLAGYFLMDLHWMWSEHSLRKSEPTTSTFLASQPLMIAHHVLMAFILCPLAVWVRKGHYFSGLLLMAEISPIFLQIRWLLSCLGLGASRLYIINGALLIGSHFWYRVAALPRAFATYNLALGAPTWFHAAWALPWHCQIGSIALTLPQIYWLWLMLLGFIRRL